MASVTDCMTGMARLISGDCDSAASPSLASARPSRYLRLSLDPESATKPRAISVCNSANALLLETAIFSASSVSVMPSGPAAGQQLQGFQGPFHAVQAVTLPVGAGIVPVTHRLFLCPEHRSA